MMHPGLTVFVEHAPGSAVDNEDLPVPIPDIGAKTGIYARNIADPEDTVESVARGAVKKLFARLHLSGGDCAGLVLASFAATSAQLKLAARQVADSFGIAGPALATNYACSGFPAAVQLAMSSFPGERRHVVIVTVELLSRMIDWRDPDTALLFGDRAAACTQHPDGRHKILRAEAEQVRDDDQLICLREVPDAMDAFGRTGPRACLRINGKPLYRLAPRRMYELTLDTVAQLGLTQRDLSLFVHHQANGRFARKIKTLLEQASLEHVQVADEIRGMGNVASSSIPCALAKLDDQLGDDMIVACPAVGAGADHAIGQLTQGVLLLCSTGAKRNLAAQREYACSAGSRAA